MEKIKVNYKASNKAVLKQVILLMGSMAEAVGQPIVSYNKKNFYTNQTQQITLVL